MEAGKVPEAPEASGNQGIRESEAPEASWASGKGREKLLLWWSTALTNTGFVTSSTCS